VGFAVRIDELTRAQSVFRSIENELDWLFSRRLPYATDSICRAMRIEGSDELRDLVERLERIALEGRRVAQSMESLADAIGFAAFTYQDCEEEICVRISSSMQDGILPSGSIARPETPLPSSADTAFVWRPSFEETNAVRTLFRSVVRPL
jgi:hypothetical protein